MGGMHGMGPVQNEKNEPVFHAAWEGRLFALRRAMAAWGKWNIDTTRHEVELVPPAEYLELSYYARQFVAFLEMLVKSKLVTRDEIESGIPAAGQPKATPALTAERAVVLIAKAAPTRRDAKLAAHLKVSHRVRARHINT